MVNTYKADVVDFYGNLVTVGADTSSRRDMISLVGDDDSAVLLDVPGARATIEALTEAVNSLPLREVGK